MLGTSGSGSLSSLQFVMGMGVFPWLAHTCLSFVHCPLHVLRPSLRLPDLLTRR